MYIYFWFQTLPNGRISETYVDTKSAFSVAGFCKDDIYKTLLDANEVSEQSASEHALIT